MAETPASSSGNIRGLLGEPEEAHLHSANSPGRKPETRDETDALSSETTELERIKTNYRRVTTARTQASSIRSREPQTIIDRLIHSLSKFWRLQVSVIVAHENCRDHLGMEHFTSSPGAILLWRSLQYGLSLVRRPGPFPPYAGIYTSHLVVWFIIVSQHQIQSK